MERTEADGLVQQLADGFETLQNDYQKLFGQYQGLERKLATAREQYNELAKLCGSSTVATPPLSLTSSPGQRNKEVADVQSAADIIEQRPDSAPEGAAQKVRDASKAAKFFSRGIPKLVDTSGQGVKIWSGPSADRPEGSSSMMPSISESPLEQDFTVEGKPSRLGCPFASMANKKLSSHAASVLSRYNPGSVGGAPSTPISSVSRVNGRDSFTKRSERRASFADPIKAEICGLSDHEEEPPRSERDMKDEMVQQQSAEGGVCPIRFLDQHSPEEVATYFERHKHELPRSHEICVKRYQSNEKQIQELDEKYGNLVSMIQGLGAKHKDMLPEEPDEDEEAVGEDGDGVNAEKIRNWASSVSAQPADATNLEDAEEERQQHFERPLRDIRVGESPSRPWGISVPPKYIEEAGSDSSSRAAEVPAPPLGATGAKPTGMGKSGGCPFGFDKPKPELPKESNTQGKSNTNANPVFISSDAKPTPDLGDSEKAATKGNDDSSRMVFTGPVFVGYSAEDAAKILRESGPGTKS